MITTTFNTRETYIDDNDRYFGIPVNALRSKPFWNDFQLDPIKGTTNIQEIHLVSENTGEKKIFKFTSYNNQSHCWVYWCVDISPSWYICIFNEYNRCKLR